MQRCYTVWFLNNYFRVETRWFFVVWSQQLYSIRKDIFHRHHLALQSQWWVAVYKTGWSIHIGFETGFQDYFLLPSDPKSLTANLIWNVEKWQSCGVFLNTVWREKLGLSSRKLLIITQLGYKYELLLLIWQNGTCPQIGSDRSAGGMNEQEKCLGHCTVLSLRVLPVTAFGGRAMQSHLNYLRM